MKKMSILALLIALIVTPIAAQETPEVVPTEAAVVIVTTEDTPAVIPVEIVDSGRDTLITTIAVFFAVALLGFGVFAGVVIRYVARLVPSELLGVVYSGGNAVFSARQRLIEEARQRAAQNDATWDDPLFDYASDEARRQWQKFVEDAAEAGVPLPPIVQEQIKAQSGVKSVG